MTDDTPCLHCKIIDVSRSSFKCRKAVPGFEPDGVPFAYFPAPPGAESAGRTPFGGPWWERPLQVGGDYVNLTKGTWWRGRVADLLPDFPCAEECLPTICGLFWEWPTIEKVVLIVHGFTTGTTHTYPPTLVSNVPGHVDATILADGIYSSHITGFSAAGCTVSILGPFGLPEFGGTYEVEVGLGPLYLFTTRSVTLLRFTDTPVSVEFCEWRARWYKPPPPP